MKTVVKNTENHLAIRLLRAFCPPHLLEEIEGDLLQRFERDVKLYGERKAKRKLLWNTVRFFRPGIIVRNKSLKHLINTIMLRNYIKIAVRNLSAHKANTAINVFGLIVGIASALVILTIIRFELSFDQFHTHADRIYRVVRVSKVEGQEEFRTGVSYPLPEALRSDITSIEKIAALQYYQAAQVDILDEEGSTEKKFKETNGVALVEPSFFTIFDFNKTGFKWIAGNPEKALTKPFSVVLTRSIAQKYFSDLDVLGKTVRLEQQLDFTITGIIEDLPPNTDFPFTIFASYSTFYEIQADQMKDDWWSVSDENQCFIVLPSSISKEEMETQIKQVHAAHSPKQLSQSRFYKLQALSEMHQDERFGNFNLRTVSKNTLWALALVGIALVLVACVNYINLATARSTLRSKEIGIRKVLGSKRSQLVIQFLSEAFVVVLVASVIGIFIAELALANLHSLLNVTPENHLITDPFVLRFLVAIILVITFLAGFYPALIVSRFNSITAIKNKLTSAGTGGYLRKTLVVFQFCITQVFAIGTLIVISQMEYFKNGDLGFEKEAIINVSIPAADDIKLKTFKDQLQTNSRISKVSVSSTTPSGFKRNRWFTDIRRKEADPKENLVCEYQSVDPEYFELYKLRFEAGRNFSFNDTLQNIIINHTLALNAGYKTAEEAIGSQMQLDNKDYIVIGVIYDFYSESMKEGFGKLAFRMNPQHYMMASIKLNTENSRHNEATLQEAIHGIENVWAQTYPETAFDYRFFDENIKAFYQEESKLSKLLQIFSMIFLFVGCLGLYGLISFVVNRKMKEVAVRKIFGASFVNILILISKDYIQLILLAFFIASPIAYYFTEKWLNGFVNHIDISWWIIIIPGIIVLGVALMAVSGQTLRAAQSNPADTLKYE